MGHPLRATTLPHTTLPQPHRSVDTEFEIPNFLWKDRRLPNTIAPSFRTCNLARRYEIEIILTLSWGLPASSSSSTLLPSSKQQLPQSITLPLKLTKVEVYSGITPPPELLSSVTVTDRPPRLPTRPTAAQLQAQAQAQRPPDPLYPPQLGQPAAAAYGDAPPSYDEAMADRLAGPPAEARPAYSGVTAENAPSTMPAGKA